MSGESDKPQEGTSTDEELSEAELAQLEEAPAVSALLKRSLAKTDDVLPAPERDAELLASVQRKLRKRSKGKFYGDGWSTTQSRLNYALIAAVMLVTIVAVYLALGPTGFSLR
jgi:predicted nucleic acid-binding protein